MDISHMNGSKVKNQIFDILPIEAEIFIYIFNSSHNFKAREKIIK